MWTISLLFIVFFKQRNQIELVIVSHKESYFNSDSWWIAPQLFIVIYQKSKKTVHVDFPLPCHPFQPTPMLCVNALCAITFWLLRCERRRRKKRKNSSNRFSVFPPIIIIFSYWQTNAEHVLHVYELNINHPLSHILFFFFISVSHKVWAFAQSAARNNTNKNDGWCESEKQCVYGFSLPILCRKRRDASRFWPMMCRGVFLKCIIFLVNLYNRLRLMVMVGPRFYVLHVDVAENACAHTSDLPNIRKFSVEFMNSVVIAPAVKTTATHFSLSHTLRSCPARSIYYVRPESRSPAMRWMTINIRTWSFFYVNNRSHD